MELKDLKVNKEIENYIQQLNWEQFERLKAGIKKDGVLEPIEIMSDGTIIDGHHRFKACRELGIKDVEIRVIPSVTTIVEAMAYTYKINLLRRQVNEYQLIEWALRKEYAEQKELAKQRMSKGGKLKGETKDATLKTSEVLADELKIGSKTFERGLKVYEDASEGIKKKLRDGEWTIGYAYTGYNAISRAPEKKQSNLKAEFENEDLTAIEISKIIQDSQMAIEVMGNAGEEIEKEFEEKYKDLLWTSKFKFKDFETEVRIAEGNPANRIHREIEKSLLTKERVEALAKKCGGYLVGEKTYWDILVDPLKLKELKKKKGVAA